MTKPSNQPVANLTAAGNEADVDEAISENHHRSPMSVSARNPTGLLDLPTELRLMILRHLLVYPRTLDIGEAFDVFYGENRFTDSLALPSCWSITRFPWITDRVQNIKYNVSLCLGSLAFTNFLKLLHHFGTPSGIRASLTVKFFPGGHACRSLNRYIQALGQFANFRTIELHVYHIGWRNRMSEVTVLEYLEARLKHVLGNAEGGSHAENTLRFHPIDHWNRCRESDDGHTDWASSLDGIRLRWNDEVT